MEAAATKSPAQAPATTPIRGAETILIVEDENAVRRLTASALANLGYDIIEAPSGPIALTLATERKRIHLLVTDVIMPEMNGRRVFEEMQAIHPGIKVLYVSGYSAEAIAHHGILDEGVQLLQKPFTMQSLAQNVRDVLSG
jgi:DNA-binding NtrC family response regulator